MNDDPPYNGPAEVRADPLADLWPDGYDVRRAMPRTLTGEDFRARIRGSIRMASWESRESREEGR